MHKRERVDVRKLRSILLLVVVPILVLFGAGVANATQQAEVKTLAVSQKAATPWKGLPAPEKGLAPCVSKAKSLGKAAGNWFCLGDTLYANSGTKAEKTYKVKGAIIAPPTNTGIYNPYDADSWCEYKSICQTKGTYTVQVKGNAAYGSGYVTYGTFDVVWVQNFNGRYPRWRMWLDWDSGPAVWPDDTFVARAMKENTWPVKDEEKGRRYFHPDPVGSNHQRSIWPENGGYYQSPVMLSGSTRYHDDLWGYFTASGHTDTTWRAATLHTGHWQWCSNHCAYFKYYY